jgi:hypothetical protein
VALEVQQPLATNVPGLGQLERAQRIPPGPETGDVIELAGQVDRNPVVPVGPVEAKPVHPRGFARVAGLHTRQPKRVPEWWATG